MTLHRVSEVNPGERMRAAQHNDLVRAVRAIPVPYDKPEWPDVFVAIVMDEGPDSEDDYDDERYWVKEVYCSDTTGDIHDEITFTAMTCDPASTPPTGFGRYVTATNLAEKADPAHELTVGNYVQVFRLYDSQTPGVVRYFFTSSVPAAGVTWTPFPDWGQVYDSDYDTGNGTVLFRRYDDNVSDGETRLFYPIAEDGSGDSVEQTWDGQHSFYFGASAAELFLRSENAGASETILSVFLDIVTTQFNVDSLDWSALPTTANIATLGVLTKTTGDSAAKWYNVNPFAEYAFSDTALHGISLRMTLTNYNTVGWVQGIMGDTSHSTGVANAYWLPA